MLTGLRQKPLISISTEPLVQFWNAGVNAYRTNMCYAVETGIRGERLFSVYHSQQSLLKHLLLENAAFRRYGWQANPVFGRRDLLTENDNWLVSRFRYDALNRPYRVMNDYLQTAAIDGNFARFESYAKNAYRLYPSLGTMFLDLVNSFSLAASKRKIIIKNRVDSEFQFASPEIYQMAKTIFDNLIEYCRQLSHEGGVVRIYIEGNNVVFQYASKVIDKAVDDRLWGSISESKASLQWNIAKKSQGMLEGREIHVAMTGESFAPLGVMDARKRSTASLKALDPTSHIDLIKMALVFVGVQPFAGYRMSGGGLLDISKTPVFRMIEASAQLIESVVHNVTRSARR